MSDEHIRIFLNRSILFREDGTQEEFPEGSSSKQARERLKKIKAEFQKGFLQSEIDFCKNSTMEFSDLNEPQIQQLKNLVNSVTSEVGRAVVGLTVLQLSIKTVCLEQSIRLHKTSWLEGTPMRSLDTEYNTPILRRNNLLLVNSYGVFMTRTLAENYPYTKFYKASIKGDKDSWIRIIEDIELNQINPRSALRFMLSALIKQSDEFKLLAAETVSICKLLVPSLAPEQIKYLINEFIETSPYSARLLEIAMHSLMQVIEEEDYLEGRLKNLSQMRSANKKHGNIGDIELITETSEIHILEAWDAKYGKPYLRDELEELRDKLLQHPETKRVGFVCNKNPDKRQDIIDRKTVIEEEFSVNIYLMSFSEWIEFQLKLVLRVDVGVLNPFYLR